MDIRTRKAYATIKIRGVGQHVELNEGMPIATLLPHIGRALMQAENRYEGISIEIDFKPILHGVEKLSAEDQRIKDIMSSWNIEPETEETRLFLLNQPSNKNGPNYDPLYAEYRACSSKATRELKTPQERDELRKHVESKYAGTEWWDGTHSW